MKKSLITATLLATALYSQSINIHNGWQLLGATEDLNTTAFDNSGCVDYLWKYNATNGASPWSVHISNGIIYNGSLATFNQIKKGSGFWIKGNANCQINTTLVTDTNSTQLENLIVGKTYYVTVSDVPNHHVEIVKFNTDKETFTDNWTNEDGTEETSTYSYNIKDDTLTLFGTSEDGDFNVTESNPIEKDSYILFSDGSKFYKTEEAAKAELNLNFTTEIINGKTFVSIKNKDNGKPSICYTFNENKSIDTVFKKNGDEKDVHLENANWHIENGKMTFTTTDENYQEWELTSQNSDDNTYTYINKWYNSDGTLNDTAPRKLKEVESCPVSELVDD